MSKLKPAPLPPDTVIGGYRVVRKLSAGGFGVVYLAVDNEGQQVAIKEYLPSSLATRPPGELLPQVAPEKLSLYRLGLKSFFEEGRSLARIDQTATSSLQPPPETAGAAKKINVKQQKLSGTLWFDTQAGRFDSGALTQELATESPFGDQTISVRLTSELTFSVK